MYKLGFEMNFQQQIKSHNTPMTIKTISIGTFKVPEYIHVWYHVWYQKVTIKGETDTVGKETCSNTPALKEAEAVRAHRHFCI
jgi:hypothetical protein